MFTTETSDGKHGIFIIFKCIYRFLRIFLICFLLLFQVFLCSGKHQFDTVQLVYFAGARIEVDGYDVGHRILMTQLFDNALTYDVVWQAGKRLTAYDVVDAGVDQL